MKKKTTGAATDLQEKDMVSQRVKIKRTFTFRFYMLILGGFIAILGIALFVLYFNTLNLIFGMPGVLMALGGGFLFYFYWAKSESAVVTDLIGGGNKQQVNSLNLMPSMVIEFKEVYEPEGFPWQCINDGKMYFVNEWDAKEGKFIPFVLPDQQIMEPTEFAQRVLGLPAHRRIFTRKPKLMEKLKSVLLVGAIGIVWLLILTTT